MVHFGSDIELAVEILLELASAPAAGHDAVQLAQVLELPVSRVQKLIADLAREGLVRQAKAQSGGWRLSQAPKKISLLAVVEAVQGHRPVYESGDVSTGSIMLHMPRPQRRGFYGLYSVMLEAERKMLRTLAGKTLSDIAT